MRDLVPCLLVLSAATLATVQPAVAQFKYCMQDENWGYPGNCQFQTYEQCMATATGFSSCAINPAYAFAQQYPGYGQQIPAYRHELHRHHRTHRHDGYQ